LLGTTPAPSPPHVFAIDGVQLRYGCFERTPAGWSLQAGRSEDLSEELFASGPLGGPLHEVRPFWEVPQAFVDTLPEGIRAASLVLPDTWLRLIFLESAELPRRPSAQEDVLRFKLKRKVPFGVEELRLSATQVTPFPGQAEPLRLMVGFAIETLAAQLEESFAGVGIHLGQVTNSTLALLSGVEDAIDPDELALVVMAEHDYYTVSYLKDGEPVLYRFKAVGEENLEGGAVRRDLRLTTAFIREHLPQSQVARALVATPQDEEQRWLEWIAEELDMTPDVLGNEHFEMDTDLRDAAPVVDLSTAQMLGAAAIEVS
jgi:hypothetical protein